MTREELDPFDYGTKHLIGKPVDRFLGDCSLAFVENDPVIRCLELGFIIRFDCRDHMSKEHFFRLMVRDSFQIWCE